MKMFGRLAQRLAQEVRELAVPADCDAVAELYALRDALDAKLAEAVDALDAFELFDADGATSTTAWLRDRAGLSRREAVRTTALVRRLRDLPVTAAAWRSGALSGGQVDAIVAVLDRRTTALFAQHERAIVPTLVPLAVHETAFAMRQWKARADAVVSDVDLAPSDDRRALHLSATLDGRWAIDGDVDAEGGETIATALRLAATDDVDGETPRSFAHRRADALVDVCRFFLDHQQTRRGGRHRPHLNVVVELDDIEARAGGRFVDGPVVGPTTLERLLCDCTIHRVVRDGASTILDYGRATRTIPAPLWNALVIRDEHCRFPGCDRPADWSEAHHVRPYDRGGPTRLDNLALVCTRHHHLLHRRGWRAELGADAALVVTDPNGRTRTSRPPGTRAAVAQLALVG